MATEIVFLPEDREKIEEIHNMLTLLIAVTLVKERNSTDKFDIGDEVAKEIATLVTKAQKGTLNASPR